MANPFYVNPGNNLAGSYAQLGSTIQGIGQQQRQDEAAERTRMRLNNFQQDYAKAVESGNPNALADLSIAYPEYQALAMQAFNITNENTGNAAAEAYMRALSDPNNADKHLFEGIQKVKSFGGTPTNMEQDLERFRQDPQASLQAIELGLAQAAPRAYKAFTERKMQAQKADITPYQQEQIDLKKQDQELRRLELEERALDRQIAREGKTQDIEAKQVKLQAEKKKIENDKKQAIADGQSAIAQAEDTISLINRITSSKGFSSAVGAKGATSLFGILESPIGGSDAADTAALLETLESKNFLNSIQQMKGLGALSDAEGKKVGAAIQNLGRNQSEKQLRKNLKEVVDITNRAIKKAKDKIKAEGGATEQVQTVNWSDL